MKIAFFFALSVALLMTPAAAQDVIRGQFPHRPSDASQIGLAMRAFERYALHTEHHDVYLSLTIKDSLTDKDRTFYLDSNTTLNGARLRCRYNGPLTDYSNMIADLQLCSTLPEKIIAGKTHVALLFWKAPLFIRQIFDASDSLITI